MAAAMAVAPIATMAMAASTAVMAAGDFETPMTNIAHDHSTTGPSSTGTPGLNSDRRHKSGRRPRTWPAGVNILAGGTGITSAIRRA